MVQGSTNLKLHVTSNLAVKSPIKVICDPDIEHALLSQFYFYLVEGLVDMSCVSMKISDQVKITGAKKGLVHVSQNIPTKSALSVSLTRPEDVIIQVHHSQHTILISSSSKIHGIHSLG